MWNARTRLVLRRNGVPARPRHRGSRPRTGRPPPKRQEPCPPIGHLPTPACLGGLRIPRPVRTDRPPHDDGSRLVKRKRVQPLAIGGLGRVGMWPHIGEQIPVWRPNAKVAALELGLGGHRRPYPDLDPVALAGHYRRHRERATGPVPPLPGALFPLPCPLEPRPAPLGHRSAVADVITTADSADRIVPVARTEQGRQAMLGQARAAWVGP